MAPAFTKTRWVFEKERVIVAAGLLVILGNYLLLGSRTTLWDRDEPRFARAAVEMLESGNYMAITFNGESWPDKPVLTYWLMALAIRILGPTELACRLFGILGTAATCGITFSIGRRLLGRDAGLWALVILASTLQVLVIGAAATSDAILLPFTIGAMAVFAAARPTGVRPVHAVGIGLLTGLAMLVKGPMGLMPALAILTVLLLERKEPTVRPASFALIAGSVVVGGLIFCAWAVPASAATEGEFLRVFIGRHVIGRALKPMEHHGGNFLLYLPYYIPAVICGFFPWTLHLPGALSALVHGRIGGPSGRRLFLGWILPPFVVMSLAATKLPHYIVFIWPALALIVGGAIVAARAGVLTPRDRDWLRGGVWFFGPVAGAIALGLIIGPWFVAVPGLRGWGAVAGLVVLTMAALAIREHLADRPQRSAVILIVGMVVFQVPLQAGVLPGLERIKISPAVARAVNTRTGPDVPVSAYKYGEPTLNFYLGRPIEYLSGPDGVREWASRPGPGILVIPRDRLDQVREGSGQLPVRELSAVKGFNYSKGKYAEVLILSRNQEQK
ncbi:MAG TPA: glycosyltransferase family 39 protein [Sedimentisphaerales bacterium]|nr:glycosyltransferase family 39 protein [Sedimentisphaerales bacterium]HRS12169.1 glycosyltransferase family 39 protein [Sedimentisphaerales bacterium]HRV48122.1 glycosyltransferase family 39 protein [Sedimentisphaerales bacterium]